MRRFHLSGLPIAAFAFGLVPVHAQEAPADAEHIVTVFEDAALDDSLFEFSYDSPNSPVLPLIGVTNDQITRVDSLRKFGVNLLSGIGSGDASPAVAIDFSPYWLLSTAPTSLWDYRRQSALGRIAARTKIGLAVSEGDKGTGKPSSFVASVGAKLLDAQDRLYDADFDTCIVGGPVGSYFKEATNAVADAIEAGKVPIGDQLAFAERTYGEFAKSKEAAISKAYAECVTQQAKRMVGRPSLDAGVGFRLSGDPGKLRNLESSGTIFWATFATGILGRSAKRQEEGPLGVLRARALAHVRYTLRETLYDDAFLPQGKRNALSLVGGIESVPSDDPKRIERLRWSLQAGWNRQNAVLPDEEDRNYWRFLGSANFRIGNGIWATASLGRVTGKGVEPDTKALIGITFTPPTKASAITSYYNSRD
ncbi:MAG: hypothetical protein J7499_13100 [Sphingopyxis sp.]|nr:hypothetical protein [Sphingopyxis sp.]